MSEDWVSSKKVLSFFQPKWLSVFEPQWFEKILVEWVLNPCVRSEKLGRIAIAASLSLTWLTVLTEQVQAGMLAFWEFDPATNQLEMTFTEQSQPSFFLLNQPPRIVIDVPNTELGAEIRQQNYSGIVREIRVAHSSDGQTRIVMELVPGVLLAPERVQLEQIQPLQALTTGGDRWRLRPLIDESQIVALETTSPQSASYVPNHPDALPPVPPVARRPNPGSSRDRDTLPQIEEMSEVPSPGEILTLPPAPSVTEEIAPPMTTTEEVVTLENGRNGVDAQQEVATLSPETTQLSASLPLSELTAERSDRTALISVPPLERTIDSEPTRIEDGEPLPDVSSSPETPQSQPLVASAAGTDEMLYSLPVEDIRRTDAPFVIVPALESTQGQSTVRNTEQISRGSLLPVGVDVQLRYAGSEVLRLEPGVSQSIGLVLNQDFYDSTGNLIAAAGTMINGRFESDRLGTQFIAEEIVSENGNIRLTGESERIGGNREVSEERVVLSSAIGAIAGAILGGLAGGNILEGAAAGTAIAYWTSPKPVLIQPGQLVQIRLSTTANF